ncbi:MAG: holin, BlyA family protein [Lachnospiraceae bacterium]|nr:holin, BlyA family protein [Lachnospiraceae bacterium]
MKAIIRQVGKKRVGGFGTVEMILLIVVLIAVVLIFKEQITGLVRSIFEKITSQALSV